MAAQKRALDDSASARKSKKSKTSSEETKPTTQASKLISEDVDFPRGGGTTFTPLEVKSIRAEAVKEADAELFEDAQSEKRQKRKRKPEPGPSKKAVTVGNQGDKIRIEHLNYKRLNVGMKILGQVASILPLALVISLPNQLLAHVPITNISSQFTEALERMEVVESQADEDEENDGKETESGALRVPDLSDIFQVGQYVRAVVTAIHAAGSTDMSGIGKSRDELVRASRRVELSLIPEIVNIGIQKSDLKLGFTITGAVKSVEDHGYVLDLGLPDITAFLSFKDVPKVSLTTQDKLFVGQLVDATVTKVSTNNRTFSVSMDSSTFASSSLSEISSVSSVLPGALVQSLITSVHPDGLNLQVLGFFEGTVDQLHLPTRPPTKPFIVGKKVKARVLYDYSASPPRFALALLEHIINLDVRKTKGESATAVQDVYPLGTILESVKVLRVEAERGIIVEIEPDLEGFIHISHLSDDHVTSLSSSGPWKPGSIHRARVTGYFTFDGLLQLSLKPTILEQKFLQVSDVGVGDIVKGTIKSLTNSGLFVSLSGNIDGVVWPNHYADIALKHPARRFKVGASLKCKVLVVDSDRRRIALTAKKTIVDSNLPIISKMEDAKPGIITHAVVFKVYDKHILVEFYNNLKALVPAKEASETLVNNLATAFPLGRVVRVRIISVQLDQGHIIASIRQGSSKEVVGDIGDIEIGNIVEGVISEIHKDNVVLTVQPSNVRALMSLKNLANHRSLSLPQLRAILKAGDKLEDLVVVTRNTEKGFVIVANKPRAKAALPPKGSALTMQNITIGQIVGGRVTSHTRHGALVKVTSQIGGTLHPTETSDNYDAGTPFPAVDTILKAVVIGVDQTKMQLTLSMRHSKMYPNQVKEVVDHQISSISDLHVGQTIRGYIKSIAEHGLFVTIGRDIDGRVQIRELFDEYVKDWKPRFQLNQLVKSRVLSVDPESKKVELSFRSGDLSKHIGSSGLTIGDVHEGQKIDGIVKRIEDYGLFIQLVGSKLNGLCHKSQLSDNKEADVTVALQGFREGDRVKAIIIGIDKRRISLSLKPSHFAEDDFNGDDAQSEGDYAEKDTLGVINDQHVVQSAEDKHGEGVNIEDAGEDDDDDDDGEMNVDAEELTHIYQHSSKPAEKTNISTVGPTLYLAGGFQWSGNTQLAEDVVSSSDESEHDGESFKKKKRKRREIEQDLTADMHTKMPESNSDFERLLLGSPNSSYLWIQYMSFQLQISEIDKAREIGRRAIKTINFREEQERLNVWIALLNLENVYGTDDSMEDAFKEAAKANDSKTIHLRVAAIYDQGEKPEKAEDQFKRSCKKFGQSSKVWTLFCEFYLKRGDLEAARKLLPRSLLSLEKRKHLKTISRFAQLEYKLGDPERGKTLFEGIVDSHPKRWDLWSIYMDMEAVQRNIQSLRNLFDRVFALKMTSHKAKAFFKKWLELEKRIGDEEGATTVKQKAIEWTQRAANVNAN